MKRVGTCSICGGDVMNTRGNWSLRVSVPPPSVCSVCGAVSRERIADWIERIEPKENDHCHQDGESAVGDRVWVA